MQKTLLQYPDRNPFATLTRIVMSS
jgi:hypothetical protein